MPKLIIALFFFALLVIGVLATETRMLFFWPGCLLLGLAGLLAAVRWRIKLTFPPSDLCLATTLLFALYITARAIFSPVAVWAREDVFILCAALVAYLLTVTACSHPRVRMGLIYVLLALTVGNLAVGMIHFSGHWDFHIVPGFARFEGSGGAGRVGGFYNNANHLASFLSMVLFMCAGWMLFGRAGTAMRLFLGFVLLTIATGTALTVSRGAVLGAAAGVAVFGVLGLWMVWQTQRHLFKWMLIGGTLLLGLGTAVLWKVNEEMLVRRTQENSATKDIRSVIWPSAVAQNAEAPLLGAGSRMFYSGCVRYRDPRMAGYNGEALFAHNEYLQMLADYGWIGLLLLAALVAVHFIQGLRFLHWFAHRKFIRTGQLSGTTLALTLGSLAALAASFTHAIVEFHWHIPAVAVTGAILLGFLANPGFDADADSSRGPRMPWARLGMKLASLAASLALVFCSLIWGAADYHAGVSAVLKSKKDAAGALEHLLRAGDIDPHNAEVFFLRGVAHLDQWSPTKSESERHRLLEAGLSDLRRACALNAHQYLYQLALSDALRATGHMEEALSAIHRAMDLAPLYEEPRVALAIYLHSLRRYEEAEMACLWAMKARAMNPTGTANWNTEHELLLRDTAYAALQQSRAAVR
ncbi:MAG: O-antigen ligase family protein [Verrucomicrobiaceae bacterium]|nr:O-antigen ligase family protein [Verrucomicrobiaceae bacterium]